MKFHPDRNPGDKAPSRSSRKSARPTTPQDDQKRAAYDRFGHAAFENGGGRAGAGGTGDFGFGTGGFADIFDEMFGEFMGGGRRGHRFGRRKCARRDNR